MSSSSELFGFQHNGHDRVQARAQISLLHRFWATLNFWSQRAYQRRQLLKLNSHQLKDIGISAADAYREGSKPFWKC